MSDAVDLTRIEREILTYLVEHGSEYDFDIGVKLRGHDDRPSRGNGHIWARRYLLPMKRRGLVERIVMVGTHHLWKATDAGRAALKGGALSSLPLPADIIKEAARG